MPLVNLGQAGVIHIGMTPPGNPKMLWYDDNQGQQLLKFYNKGSVSWEPLVTGSNSAVLQNELRVIGVTVGAVSDGKVWASGTQIETVLRDIFSNIQSPTYSPPTASLSLSPSTTIYEVGENITVDIVPSFTQRDAGPRNSYSLVKNGNELTDVYGSFSDNFTIILDNNLRHSAIIGHDEGDPKFNNAVPPALDPTGKILAGSLSPFAPQIVGVYPYFYGASDDNNIDGNDIYSGNKVKSATPGTIVLPNGFGTGNKFIWFAVPQHYGRNFTAWYRTSLNNGNIGSSSDLFGAKTTVNVTSVGLGTNWTNVPFDLYISNYKTGAASYTELRP